MMNRPTRMPKHCQSHDDMTDIETLRNMVEREVVNSHRLIHEAEELEDGMEMVEVEDRNVSLASYLEELTAMTCDGTANEASEISKSRRWKSEECDGTIGWWPSETWETG